MSSINWRNLQANTLESLATESGNVITDVMPAPFLPGAPKVCKLDGKQMRCSEAKARIVAKLESIKLANIVGVYE